MTRKNLFEKGYSQTYTKEVFEIVFVGQAVQVYYRIKDLNNEHILGSFYEEELSLVDNGKQNDNIKK